MRIEDAKAWATALHSGQADKAGEPYIEHPARVVGHLLRVFPDATDDEIQAAWLHDVMEDCGVSADEMLNRGYSPDVASIVSRLTKPRGISYPGWILSLASDGGSSAIRVKIADIMDNADPRRLRRLDEETRHRLVRKYHSALSILRRALTATGIPPNEAETEGPRNPG